MWCIGLLVLLSSAPEAPGTAPPAARTNPRHEARRPASEGELKSWLVNMVAYHGFTADEVSAATGLGAAEVERALTRFGIERWHRPPAEKDGGERVTLLPYPGGRHPRIGFLEGAIDPQRETKVSVFMPWDARSYVVVDVPEAVWSNLGLTYLAHTHIPTIWTRRNVELEKLEWRRAADGSLETRRTLPNGIAFGTRVRPAANAALMELWLTNGTDGELTGLRAQVCVMLKGAAGFTDPEPAETVLAEPYAARRSAGANRWVITAWEPTDRTWQNKPVPCIHSDPKFPDCRPGETVRARGILAFYEGDDLAGELKRLDGVGWRGPLP